MRPGECGTVQLPPDDSPDREAVDQFREFLAEVDRRGIAAVAADPAWRPYLDGNGPAPRIDREEVSPCSLDS